MHKTSFEISDCPVIFDGYTDGAHWNGWACPWFDKETAMYVMHEWREFSLAAYDETHDKFVFYADDGTDPEEFKGQDVIIDNKPIHLYPIGNGCWVWDDIAEHQAESSKIVWDYLRREYFHLSGKTLGIVYRGILSEINGYMSERELIIYTDAFVRGYETREYTTL